MAPRTRQAIGTDGSAGNRALEIAVATALPVFFGYTPRADNNGTSLYNQPVHIRSLADYLAFFALPNPPAPADTVQQYSPQYYLVAQGTAPGVGPNLLINGTDYAVLPDPGTIYYLYNSIRLFYENGGGDAWVVAVGPYGTPSGSPLADAGAPLFNPNVKLADLLNALALLKTLPEPTIYVCPDATLLSAADNATLTQAMLLQLDLQQSAICLLDVINGNQPDPRQFMQDIEAFRSGAGTMGLKNGVCYYPFLGTTIMQAGEIDFTNLFGGDITQLGPLLNPSNAPNPAAEAIIAEIENPPATPLPDSQLHSALLAASGTYAQIIGQVMTIANTLPASSAIAGLYAANDRSGGVWSSPVNNSIAGCATLPLTLSIAQRDSLITDEATGKLINPFLAATGQGILVTTAFTLDSNSPVWRDVSVRRTMIFLEQSVKLAARAYVNAPNDANTWAAVKSMISSLLTDVWRQGGLQGARPEDAFSVVVGPGVGTATGDVPSGYMQVLVRVAVVRPAEFFEIIFQEQMAKSG